jgi:hypothetical protein
MLLINWSAKLAKKLFNSKLTAKMFFEQYIPSNGAINESFKQ